jgi:hypothetical protein
MPRQRSQQPTLFEVTACNEFEPLPGLRAEHAASTVTPQTDPSVAEGKVSSAERQAFRGDRPSDSARRSHENTPIALCDPS